MKAIPGLRLILFLFILKWPVMAEDAASAFSWIKKNVAILHANPRKLFIVGHSSGALIASLLSTDENTYRNQVVRCQILQAVLQWVNLFFNFAILAIFISCLGLLGLSSYNTIQCTREIGVRKVLGASVFSIVNLLSVDFIKLVLIAFVIATPLAWVAMDKWLQEFAYRTNVSWWMFALAISVSLLIAFATISFQSIKAAIANPVKSLRAE